MTLRHNDFQSLIMPAHMVDKMTECVLQEKADRKPCRIGRQSQDIKRRIRVDGDTVKIKGHPVLDMRKQGIQGLIVDGIVIFKKRRYEANPDRLLPHRLPNRQRSYCQ